LTKNLEGARKGALFFVINSIIMATASSPLARQPDKLDYASPTQFRFGIKQLPKVEFFTIKANLPGIEGTSVDFANPFKNIPSHLSLMNIWKIINHYTTGLLVMDFHQIDQNSEHTGM
jgi:hypothetical protein